MKELSNQTGKRHSFSYSTAVTTMVDCIYIVFLMQYNDMYYFFFRSALITFASLESVKKALALSGTSFFSRTVKVTN